MDAATLYDEDFYAWSEQQAAVLRRLGQGRVSLPNDLDLEHVAEEVEDLGKAQLSTVRSMLRQSFMHVLKIHMLPNHDAVQHWRAEVRGFLGQAMDHYSRSMRQHIDLDELWRRAVRDVREELEEIGGDQQFLHARTGILVLTGCPFTIEGLLGDRPSVDVLLSVVRSIGTDP